MGKSMGNAFHCVIVGGGYAGIHAAKEIAANWRQGGKQGQLHITLIDIRPAHLQKVMLFKPAVGDGSIEVPWERVLPAGASFIRGMLRTVDAGQKQITYSPAENAGNAGNTGEAGTRPVRKLQYDALIVALGSVTVRPAPELGGIVLGGQEEAAAIRARWQANLRLAVSAGSQAEQRRLMAAAVVGAGFTGIETAAELGYAMRLEAARLGLDPGLVKVHLINSHSRLFAGAAIKVSERLERSLAEYGVAVQHEQQAIRADEQELLVKRGPAIPVGLTIWALGLQANPAAGELGLPVTSGRGGKKLLVDASYRVAGAPGVYSIGDCAHIVDPATGLEDGMTCREAIGQAKLLGRIVRADATGKEAPCHKRGMDAFAIALGPGNGLIWTRKWGLDMIISGKLAYRAKVMVWKQASLL